MKLFYLSSLNLAVLFLNKHLYSIIWITRLVVLKRPFRIYNFITYVLIWVLNYELDNTHDTRSWSYTAMIETNHARNWFFLRHFQIYSNKIVLHTLWFLSFTSFNFFFCLLLVLLTTTTHVHYLTGRIILFITVSGGPWGVNLVSYAINNPLTVI